MSNSALRCTNAVAAGWTLLTAPPSASNAIAPPPPAGPLCTWLASSVASIAALTPAGFRRSVKKSDLAKDGTRGSTPLGLVLHCITVRLLQPASRSIALRKECSFTDRKLGWEPTRLISERITRLAPATLPSQVPPAVSCGEPPKPQLRCMFDHSSAGPCGAQDCQALITRLALAHGQPMKNSTSELSLCVRSVNEVATPKLPPPPPLLAQSRSVWFLESQLSTLPSAVTICSDSMASLVRPNWRDRTPIPPPSARPARPTVGQEPPGTARPRAASR